MRRILAVMATLTAGVAQAELGGPESAGVRPALGADMDVKKGVQTCVYENEVVRLKFAYRVQDGRWGVLDRGVECAPKSANVRVHLLCGTIRGSQDNDVVRRALAHDGLFSPTAQNTPWTDGIFDEDTAGRSCPAFNLRDATTGDLQVDESSYELRKDGTGMYELVAAICIGLGVLSAWCC